MQNAEVSTSKV